MKPNRKTLFILCLAEVDKKIKTYRENMDAVKESMEANDVHTDYDEEGNKGQLLNDFEKYARYLDNAQKMKEKLTLVDREHFSEQVQFGSIVETKDSYFFIATALGDIILDDGGKVHVISTEAPIFAELKGKKKGETFKLNEKDIEILDVH
ncbi:MAG: transcription elongation factor [Gillisia sp.]